MAWEKRTNGKRYYYLSTRQGGRVKKEYYGSGEIGVLASNAMQLKRIQHEEVQKTKQKLQTADDLVREMDLVAKLVLHATMIRHGYQRNGRHPWRRPTNG